MTVKVFTVEEANRVLPTVREAVRFIRARVRRMGRLHDRISVLSLIGAEDPKSPEHRELQESRRKVQELRRTCTTKLDVLQKTGCVIKDLNQGLVDFYGRNGDRLVFLCWRFGEKQISFWHELEGGFAGRRPISELDVGKQT